MTSTRYLTWRIVLKISARIIAYQWKFLIFPLPWIGRKINQKHARKKKPKKKPKSQSVRFGNKLWFEHLIGNAVGGKTIFTYGQSVSHSPVRTEKPSKCIKPPWPHSFTFWAVDKYLCKPLLVNSNEFNILVLWTPNCIMWKHY